MKQRYRETNEATLFKSPNVLCLKVHLFGLWSAVKFNASARGGILVAELEKPSMCDSSASSLYIRSAFLLNESNDSSSCTHNIVTKTLKIPKDNSRIFMML